MKTITRREALKLMATGVATTALAGCATQEKRNGERKPEEDASLSRRLRILATSDLHGMFVSWDYALDKKNTLGSVAQLATAIGELRDKDTLLVDAGDTIQDNMAEIFLADDIHPMIACMNVLGYDIGVTGNHEYDYGMDVLRKAMASFEGKVLTGNVVDQNGDPIADGYTIINKNDVRVGVIGMVTPRIAQTNSAVLEGYEVSDPAKETRKIIDQIKGKVDVLVGVMHMDVGDEYDQNRASVRNMAMACPEFDLIVAAHGHQLVEGEEINGVLVVENQYHGQTMAVVDLTLEPNGEGWKVAERVSSPVYARTYESDPRIVELMAPYDERAKEYAHEEIGTLEGGPLVPTNEIDDISTATIMDTALVDLINEVQLYQTQADVSSVAVCSKEANIEEGTIRRCDVSLIYKFSNTLYTLQMTGSQLKTYLEWCGGFYQQYHDGDLTIAFNPNVPIYNHDMFTGVTYKVNIAKEVGERIEELAWPSGAPVADDDTFTLVTNNHRAATHLLVPGVVFEEDNLPLLLETDVNGSMGGLREMIADYIENVKGGTITPTCDNNWQLVGNDWDPELHQMAVELMAKGKIAYTEKENAKLPTRAITVDDVKNAQ